MKDEMGIHPTLDPSPGRTARAELRWMRFALDRTPDAAFVIGSSGEILYVNERACSSLGYERQELLGLSIQQVITDLPASWEETWSWLQGADSRTLEASHETSDGGRIPVELAVKAFSFGGRDYASIIARDISGRRLAEENLRKTKERLELALRGADLGMWEWNVTTGEVHLHPGWAETLGYRLTEIEPKSTAWRRLVHPQDRPAVERTVRAHLAGHIDNYKAEYRMRSHDGGWRWVRDSGRVYERDSASRPLRMAGVRIDITELKRQEEQRAERLRRIQLYGEAIVKLATDETVSGGDFELASRRITETVAEAMEVARVSIWLLSADRTRLCCVDLYERGTREHSAGRILHVEEFPTYFEALATGRAIAADDAREDPRTREFRRGYLEPLGIVSMLDSCIRRHGQLVGIVCHEQIGEVRHWTADDTSFAGEVADQAAQALAEQERLQGEEERRELEAQIQQAQKLESLGILAGGIAHDFNNLLMAILGNADLALSEISSDSPARSFIEDIERASRRAADLCRQMLAYSGRGRFVVEVLDLRTVVREMAEMLEFAISKRVTLRYDFPATLPNVEADPTQLRQVIMNLITNASEAIGDQDGVITVRTGAMHCDRRYLRQTFLDEQQVEGDYAYLEVEDTGCGMDASTRGRVFDPFFSTKFTGRGLGMAAVLGIVRSHRGAVHVSSEPGHGSSFRVLLPVCTQQREERQGQGREGGAWRGRGKVLLVDDDPTVRTVGSRMLESIGFEVLCASDGCEAVELFRARKGDIVCVLLDLTMPRLDGEATFRQLRRLRDDLPVILSSGYDEQDVKSRFSDTHRFAFVQKPYTVAALRSSLATVLPESKSAPDA